MQNNAVLRGGEEGGIISRIGRPSGIMALSLAFIGTGTQMGGAGGGSGGVRVEGLKRGEGGKM